MTSNIITNGRDNGNTCKISGTLFTLGYCYDSNNPSCNLCYRESVSGLSESASSRMGRYLRSCRADYCVFITLTYPDGYGTDGRVCKRDLDAFCKWYLRQGGELSSVFWFMEFTDAGRIHYHLLGTEYVSKKKLASAWYKICGTENVDHLCAGTRIEAIRKGRAGMVKYAIKYAKKQSQKIVPDDFGWCGRFWGVRGYKEVLEASTRVRPSDMVNSAVRQAVKSLNGVIRLCHENGYFKPIELGNDYFKYFNVESFVIADTLKDAIDALSLAVVEHRQLVGEFSVPCGMEPISENLIKSDEYDFMNPVEVTSWLLKRNLTGECLDNDWKMYGCLRRDLERYDRNQGI